MKVSNFENRKQCNAEKLYFSGEVYVCVCVWGVHLFIKTKHHFCNWKGKQVLRFTAERQGVYKKKQAWKKMKGENSRGVKKEEEMSLKDTEREWQKRIGFICLAQLLRWISSIVADNKRNAHQSEARHRQMCFSF